MSDLISREMLIHSLCSYDEEPAKYCVPCREVLEIVKSIPSMPIWIPCSEKLPESGVRVFTCFGNIVEIQELSYISGEWENDGGDTQEFAAVSAWMPLPEPYKEDEA